MDIIIPEVGESIREALLAEWFKKNGDMVKKDEPLCELETDKITLDVNADADGILTILVNAGETLAIGSKIGSITESSIAPISPVNPKNVQPDKTSSEVVTSPSVRLALRENGISQEALNSGGRGARITLDDLFSRIQQNGQAASETVINNNEEVKGAKTNIFEPAEKSIERPLMVRSEDIVQYGKLREERVAMSPIRKRIAERLLAVRQQTAMLTTFNEVDMTRVNELRQKHRQHFLERHGAPLGLMPFFVKACCMALAQFPLINASIDGDQIVYHNFYDVGIAIGGEKGLVVPVIRSADNLKLFEIDAAIGNFVEKIHNNKLSLTDLEGGTFTITNGGVYGSLLSTPIINPPQSAVLGMHAIQERPVVREGQIVVRQMMNLALSYDHRLIDGREAVNFLKKIKEYIEEPEELLLEG